MCAIKPVKWSKRDGLQAVSLIGLLDWLISGPEAWILHSTAHLEEGFNLSMWEEDHSVCFCVSNFNSRSTSSFFISSSVRSVYLVFLFFFLCHSPCCLGVFTQICPSHPPILRLWKHLLKYFSSDYLEITKWVCHNAADMAEPMEACNVT